MTHFRRALLTILAGGLVAFSAPAQVAKFTSPAGKDGKPARILEGAEVPPNASILYLSGQLASPIHPDRPATSLADFGDTKTQAASTLAKIKKSLEAHGYSMRDVIKMTVFVVADPKLGKMDFDGLNQAFDTFFNVAENPTTTARSALQVSALASPNFLVEIEVIAAKVK